MTFEKNFPLCLAFEQKHYLGTITPSVEKGPGGMPLSFRVTLGDEVFADLYSGDDGWQDRLTPGLPNPLANAIGNYILQYYEQQVGATGRT